jgi:hypothetical protein
LEIRIRAPLFRQHAGDRFERARLTCICAVDGEVVLDGEALVKVPSAKAAKGKRPMIKL